MARTRTRATGSSPSVLIISAAMGAGHDGVAFELERRLHARGAHARVVDYLELLPARLGPFYRAFYHGQLKYAPSSYEWLYGKMDKGVLAPLSAWFGQMGQRKVRRLARHHDVVISTYPLGCQATGALRKKGKLRIPAVGFLTDVDVHALWLHPGVDLNFTVWQGSAAEAVDRVGSPSTAVGPVLPAAFLTPPTEEERAEGRALMGLPEDQIAVLVVAGSWGVGDISTTARAIRDAGVGTPVVLCGRNEDLREELEREEGIVAIGWTTAVRTLLAASDVLVHNAGGLSCLEGFAVGVPVIGHACLPGHGHRNAEAMRDAGVAAYADSTESLVTLIRELARTPAGAAMTARARDLFQSDPTDHLLRLAAAPVPERRVSVTPARRWAQRVAAAGIGVPLAMSGASVAVAQATEHAHLGVAEGAGAIYAAVLVNHSQVTGPTIAALRAADMSAAVAPGDLGPTPTDVARLVSHGVSVIGSDGVMTGNPARQGESIDAAAAAVAAAHEVHAKVVCLHTPGMFARVVAWRHRYELARPDAVLLPGTVPPYLTAGRQYVLDERGRTPTELASDLKTFLAEVAAANLPVLPMRDLWPQV